MFDDEIVVELGSWYVHYGFCDSTSPHGGFDSTDFSILYNDNETEENVYYLRLLDFWDKVLNIEFQVKTKDKEISLLRPLFVCDRFIQKSQEILFQSFKCKEVHVLLKCFLPILTTGFSSGLVVDFQYQSISIVPIAFGICNLMAFKELPFEPNRWKQSLESSITELSYSILDCLSELPVDVLPVVFPRVILIGKGHIVDGLKEIMDKTCQNLLITNNRFARLRSQDWKGVFMMSEINTWKGFCIARLASIRGDTMKKEEWSHGKRWKDPLLYLVCLIKQ